jgi:HD-GYP domain-containing protein (c-di-GMP phosphodiesterase class II)
MTTETQVSQERLTEIFEQTILAITEAVAARDQYTADHQKDVAELSVAIAKEIGMSGFRIQGLRLAAMIHDLGNIKIPTLILNKPGRLSEIEFEMIKTHPQAGYDIIKGIEFPWPIAEIVLQHHEHVDGSGYPRGLKGDEILLESRILMVANVIESMTSYRPSHEAFPIEAAIAEIGRYRGTRYDAAVVYACIRVLQRGEFPDRA